LPQKIVILAALPHCGNFPARTEGRIEYLIEAMTSDER
jgi:hypothetical protein